MTEVPAAPTSAGYGFSGGSGQQQPIPEPATMLLLGSGLAGLAAFREKGSGKPDQV